MDTPESTSSLAELQKSFDASAYTLNRKLIKLLISSESDLKMPVAWYNDALVALQGVRVVLHLLETWLVDNAPD